MGASLNQPCRVQEEGPTGCKLLLQGKNPLRGGLKVPENKDRLTPCQQPR
jgi:hypothetical protein